MNFSKYNWDKKQSKVDIQTTTNPYYYLSESTIWDLKKFHFKYTNKGFQVGTYISLTNPEKQIIPIMKVEGLFNQFSLYGDIKAGIQNLNPDYFDGNTNGNYVSDVEQNLSWRFGYGIGMGIRYRIGKLNIKPIVSFYKHFKEFPYHDHKYTIKTIGTNEEILRDNDTYYRSKMKIKYYSFGVGLEYDL